MEHFSHGIDRGLLTAAIAGALGLAFLAPAQAAQPVYAPPYPALPNILYVVPYAVSTQPLPPAAGLAFPDAETIITITVPKGCRVQVEWLDWDGTTAGVSGPPVPPPPLVPPGGSLQFHTQAALSPPLPGMPPYDLNVLSNLAAPFEGKANIRSDCAATKKFQIDAGFEVILIPGDIPRYKRIPVVRPIGNAGG